MKKMWNQYSYAITLILLSCSLALILSVKQHSNSEDQYIKVTISEGDSLWNISNEYSDQHSLTNKEFVGWVKKHNKGLKEQLLPGEEIVIPVSKDDSTFTAELASAPGN
jgi:cell division protein YceG involved in septum cleavage